MQDLSHIHNKKLAVIMIEDEGTEDSDCVVLWGTAKWREGRLFVHCGMDIPEFSIPEEALDRIKPVAPEVRDVLEEADYSVMLTVWPIPDAVDPKQLIADRIQVSEEAEMRGTKPNKTEGSHVAANRKVRASGHS